MAEFTKGPWDVNPRAKVNVADKNGRGVATTGGYMDSTRAEETDKENKANANLIAAAPEMYEAVKQAISYLDSFDCWREGEELLHHILSTALRKAEGKEQS